MSAKATFWAWEVDVPSVHHRAVLLCLADCHNSDTNQCNPSVKFISEKTKCDRKTVMKVVAELVDFGLVFVTKKLGAGNQYALQTSTADGTSTAEGTSTTSGTPTSTADGTPPVPPAGHEPKKNLKGNLKIYRKISLTNLPECVSQETAREFIDHRINLKKPPTQNAFDRAMSQAEKWQMELGLSANQIIEHVIDAGWQWPQLEWLRKRLGEPHAHNQRPNQSTHAQRISHATLNPNW